MKKILGIFQGGKRKGKELEWMDFDNEEEYDDVEIDDEDDEYYEDEDDEYYEDEEDGEDEYYEIDEEDEDDEYYEDDEDGEDEYYEIDEDEEDNDEYYEDDEGDEDDDERNGFGAVVYKLTHLPAADYAVAFTGVAVLVLAIVTGSLYLNARNIKKQVETFAGIGAGLDGIDMIGEQGLVAIADAQAAKLMAATMEPEDWQDEEPQENEDDGKKAQVVLNLTSIQKDLKIKFVNSKTGKLISNIAFEVEIEDPAGKVNTKIDDDKDGIIYQTEMTPGKYNVKIVSPSSNDDYDISSEKIAITVRDTIEYKKVDVADEVKTEAQVNAAVEDTKVNETVVESVNVDTVEWVESTKTLIEGTQKTEDSYEKVDYAKDIIDPSTKAGVGFRLLVEEEPTQEPDPTEAPTQAPVETPTPEPDPTEVPTQAPVETPTPEPDPTEAPTEAPATATPTAVPSVTPIVTATPAITPSATPSASSSATPTASVTPSASPSVSPSATPTATPNKAKTDTTTTLKSISGEVLYVKGSDGKFREAKYADYYTTKEFYRKKSTTTGEYRYTGWQVLDGVTYFFDKNGNKVTGEQVILGAKYSFNSDGSLNKSSGSFGIDVSKWNGNIDWNAVKNSGVSYVIIRCGYRGSTTGALIEDPKYRANIQGALGAGIKVGIYFFTQAVNEVEAVEEASMVLGLVKGYNITFPIFLDVEASGGRADGISASTRTAVCKAFCQTIQNSGYKAGIYANKTWFNEKIETPSLTSYKIWLAQYAAAPSYSRTKYDMWQYSSSGSVPGISGSVDMNTSYMGY